ncbi:LysR family transcriptional regulator [Vibrio methylphosphonaticus]|uniref:LysR family transcriptional regulator n=1 Tax=Vibrio methylphosphonaticus TaxID=2946866 RepID=UPI00202A00E6|nr:LysR family transcriptional regulator [Vibrio methylphosphonaticus]MCL9777554.1 LysR family transcriptional regulator [Vibrio methylphosphonaticus]
MFTHDQVTSFCSVYENGSFSAGARAMNRDRSTVREHISIMEDSIAVPLFEIIGKSAHPTETAHKLYPRALVLIRQLKEFNAEAMASFDGELSSVYIYYDAIIPCNLIASVEEQMSVQFPHIRFHWLQRSRQESMEDLGSGKAHLALMPVLNRLYPEDAIIFTNLGSVRFSFYASANSRLAKLDEVTRQDLQMEKQYIVENHHLANLNTSKISPHYHLVSSNDVLIALLKKQGWAMLPDEATLQYSTSNQIKRIEIKELINRFNFSICTFHSPANEGNPIIDALRQSVYSYAKKYLS